MSSVSSSRHASRARDGVLASTAYRGIAELGGALDHPAGPDLHRAGDVGEVALDVRRGELDLVVAEERLGEGVELVVRQVGSVVIDRQTSSFTAASGSAARQRSACSAPCDDGSRSCSRATSSSPAAPSAQSARSDAPAEVLVGHEAFGCLSGEPALQQVDVRRQARSADRVAISCRLLPGAACLEDPLGDRGDAVAVVRSRRGSGRARPMAPLRPPMSMASTARSPSLGRAVSIGGQVDLGIDRRVEQAFAQRPPDDRAGDGVLDLRQQRGHA